jgi:hypothetical protein
MAGKERGRKKKGKKGKREEGEEGSLREILRCLT